MKFFLITKFILDDDWNLILLQSLFILIYLRDVFTLSIPPRRIDGFEPLTLLGSSLSKVSINFQSRYVYEVDWND